MSEIRKAGSPDRVANVLHDAGPDRLRDISARRLERADPRLRARLLGRTAAKPTHVVWALGPTYEATDPTVRLHDYSLHRSDVDYAGSASCSPEVHANLGHYVERWHNHRYDWFVTMILSDHGYTEDRIEAPEGAMLVPGPVSPEWYGGPSVPLWQPNAIDLQRVQTKVYSRGDIAVMGLYDLHRLRDQCGALSFFVQGPVAGEASTVFDDELNVSFQPSDFGPTRLESMVQRLEGASASAG